MATSAPAIPKPSATLVPAALGDKAQFTRKRSAAETPDDDMAAAMRAAVKKARGMAAPKTPPKAMPKTPPKAAPKAEPAGKPQSKSAAMPKKGGGGKSTGELDHHLERLGVGTGTAQAPTCFWTSRKGGKIFLAGLAMRQTVNKFPTTARRSAVFPMLLRAGRG